MAWESFGVIKGLSSSIGNPKLSKSTVSCAPAPSCRSTPTAFDRTILGRTAMTTKTNTAAGIPLKEVGTQGFGSTGVRAVMRCCWAQPAQRALIHLLLRALILAGTCGRLHVTRQGGKMRARTHSKSSRDKVRAHRKRLRQQGLRPIQIWVPDMRSPAFVTEAHRQSLAVANSPHAKEDQDFIDAVSDWGAV